MTSHAYSAKNLFGNSAETLWRIVFSIAGTRAEARRADGAFLNGVSK